MTRTRTRLALVGIALLTVVAAVPAADDAALAAEHTFVVQQGDQCYEVSPLRGDEDVASFYDYRNPQNHNGEGRLTYSSFMPDHLTQEDGSRLFLYEGPDGVSLVMIHNARGGDRGDGTAVTFQFSGLPESGSWAVQDDDYDGRDDQLSRDQIDWTWYGDRTDGAAFRGVDRGDTEITLSPAFDEEAVLYDSPVDRDGNTETWEFLTGSLDDPTPVELDRDAPITLRTGHCGPDERPPSADLSGEDGVAGFPVTLDAGGSTDDREIAAYRWDFDGDGEIDRETNDPTISHTFEETGAHNVAVTVVDGDDNTDEAQTSVEISPDDPPSAAFRVVSPETPVEGEQVVFDAGNSSDDTGIAEYRWTFGENVTATGEQTATTFDENGTYEVTLEVVDDGGNDATTTREVEVLPTDETPPDAAISANLTAVESGVRVGFDASDSADDRSIDDYGWDFDGDGGVDRRTETATATYAFDSAGTYDAAVFVTDGEGNTDSANVTVEVGPARPPNVSATVPDEVAAGETFEVEGSASDDGEVATVQWEFGDGATADGERATHAFDEAGTYDVTFTAVDAGGHANATTHPVEVRQSDETPPTAALAVETNRTDTGERIQFDAGDSTDDQGIAAYRWDFDGDGDPERETANASVDYTYGSAGTYDATVVVVDRGNNTDSANVTVDVERSEQPHDGGGGGNGGSGGTGSSGGGGSTAVGPPPVLTETETRGPDAGLVDVRNARADEVVRADLPATEAADETGVRFREVGVALADDDPHFAVETSRAADELFAGDPSGSDSLPADVTLAGLSASEQYLDAGQVESVTYEVAVERSRLDETGLGAGDLRAFQRTDDAWERADTAVVERGETVVLRIETDGFGQVAIGGDRTAAVTDASLAEREVVDGDPVAATATVENPEAEARTVAVNLMADGEVVTTESVEVPGDDAADVTVEATLPPGEYRMAVDGADAGVVTVVERALTAEVTDVTVNESTVAPGEKIEIAATVENAGSEAGERTVALTLFGERVATETVEVPPGESTRVTFVRAVTAPGDYTATVGNESATFAVREAGEAGRTITGEDEPAGTSVPVPGFGVGTAAVALVAVGVLVGRLAVRAQE